MSTSISLGSLVTVNGKTRSVGSASNLDVKSIVDSLVAVKTADKTKLTDKITADTAKLNAVGQYRTMLATLQTTANFLKNPSGVSNDANNIFQYRKISASTANGTDAANYMTASSSAGATLGTYNIQINNLAVAQSSTSISFSSETAPLATATGAGGTPKAGGFSFNGQIVNIAVGDTLDNIAAAINGTTANSNVRADIIKVSDTDFRLKISAVKTGVDNGYVVRGDTTVFNSMFTGGASTAVAPLDANLTLDGNLTVTRPTNSVADLISGITFTLQQPTTGGNSITIGVLPDSTAAESKITDFVTAYNNIKTFIATQQQRDSSGALLKNAILGEDGLLNNFVSSAATEISQAISNLPGGIQSLANIGIKFTDDPGSTTTDADGNPTAPPISNILQIDTAKLEAQLDSNFDGVRGLFEFQLSSNAPDRVSSYKTTNAISINAFTMNADFSKAAGSQITLDYTDSSGNPQSLAAVTTFYDQVAATSKAASAGIFGATTTTGAFTGLTDGDTFRITLNKADGTTVNNDFVYKASPSAANEFNSLSTLNDAITNTITGVTSNIDSSGKLNITPTGQFDTLTFTNTTATDFKTNLGFADTQMPTGTVSGPKGSPLEGLTMIYAPRTATDSVNITLSQGVGDRFSNLLNGYLTADTGFLDLRVADLNKDKDSLTTQSTDLQTKIDDYQTQLYSQYAALDQAVSKVNSLLQLLDAQDKARQQSSN